MTTILVVDDHKIFRELLVTVLELEGHEAVPVTRAEEVVNAVRERKPALILMDVHVGNRDTLGVLQELKQDADLSYIPVIMTSGMDRSHECLDAGANEFVLKPFHPSEMLTKVEELTQTGA